MTIRARCIQYKFPIFNRFLLNCSALMNLLNNVRGMIVHNVVLRAPSNEIRIMLKLLLRESGIF